MNDPDRVLAEGKGVVIWRSRPIEVFGVAIDAAGGGYYLDAEQLRWLIHTGGPAALDGVGGGYYLDAEQLRWLIHTGGPAALAALDQPAPATEGPTP